MASRAAVATNPPRTKVPSPLLEKLARYVRTRAAVEECLCLFVTRTNAEKTLDHGSCHCGKVTLAVKVDKPLDTIDAEGIVECNCSICARVSELCLLFESLKSCPVIYVAQGAYVWIYTPLANSIIQGEEHLAYRRFSTNIVGKAFCRHCGVHICNKPSPLTGEYRTQPALPQYLRPF
jgi:hypothetical protein